MKMRNEIMRHFKFDEEWFERQFGKRPERSLYDINNDIDICRCKLNYLEKELLEYEVYSAKEDAALKCFINTVYNIKKGNQMKEAKK